MALVRDKWGYLREPPGWMEISAMKENLFRLQAVTSRYLQQIVDAQNAGRADLVATREASLASHLESIAILQAEIAVAEGNPPAPAQSAAAAVTDANGTPPADSNTTTAASTAVVPVTVGDSGINPPIKTQEQTQATSNAPAVNNGSPTPTTSPGIGVPADAGVPPSASASKTVSETYSPQEVANKQITPRPNVLDNFSSYTYRASVYLMSPDQYIRLVTTRKKTVNGYQLLFQSGGAPNNTGGKQTTLPGANAPDAGRNPAFPNDFYIDSVTVENLIAGGGIPAAHGATKIKFTVIEPYGITLIDRLYEAVQDVMGKDSDTTINYVAATYLLVIRFYGYDASGNLVTGIGAPDINGSSDSNAVIEKFIPFRIAEVNMQIQNKAVQYNFEAAPVGQIIASGTRRGTIPYDIALSASTVKELLGSDDYFNESAYTESKSVAGNNTSTSTAPPNAAAAPTSKKSVTQGLMAMLNKFQKELVQKGIYAVADQYEIVFANGAENIASAKIMPPGTTKIDAKQTPTAPPPTVVLDNIDPAKVRKDTSVRNWSIYAGMQIVQVIELAIRNSTYILGQQLIYENTETNEVTKNDKATGKPVSWFQIGFEATQLLPYDKLRNDYAFKVKFIISWKKIDNYNSKYFPVNKFNGVHKSYKHWFTGQNSAVLDYQETLNNLYRITVSGSDKNVSMAELYRRNVSSSMREMPFYNFDTTSTESMQGGAGKTFEAAANLAETLYDPKGLANAKIKIIGDPAWMQQGSLAGGVSAQEFNYSAFLPDGTINFDASQVMFEIAWQKPEDYDINTGLADPYSRTAAQGGQRQPLQSRIYTAIKVVNEFKQGKFEQTIDGRLYTFMKPDASNKAAGASDAANWNIIDTTSGSQAEFLQNQEIRRQAREKRYADKAAVQSTPQDMAREA